MEGPFNDGDEDCYVGRVTRVDGDDLYLRCADRYAQEIVKDLNLEEANPVLTPGTELDYQEGDDELLSGFEKEIYGRCVGKAIYMATERPEAQYAIKEMAREISNPTKRGWRALRRFGRFLLGTPKVELRYSRSEN
eukprot:7424877-Alexandrium_andersonii.AAC.1